MKQIFFADTTMNITKLNTSTPSIIDVTNNGKLS